MACFLVISLAAQEDLPYQIPHDDIMVLADAEPVPYVRLTSDGQRGLLFYRRSYKSISELSEPEMRLAGLRINPNTNIGSRRVTIIILRS